MYIYIFLLLILTQNSWNKKKDNNNNLKKLCVVFLSNIFFNLNNFVKSNLLILNQNNLIITKKYV